MAEAFQSALGECFFDENESEMNVTPFHEYIAALCRERGEAPDRVIRRADIEREYIEGTPLDRYMAGRALPPARAVSVCAELCDILAYLHTRDPAIIHRDIKPQNVIVRPNGSVALIGFDIARAYDADAQTDTQFMGTRAYAPPEQYGFAQTDCRADIYSLGVLLRYMLTGQANPLSAKIKRKPLAAVVRRLTTFAPEQRFADAAEVKKALLRAERGQPTRMLRASFACLAAILLLSAGFALGYAVRGRVPASEPKGVLFEEPLIERAVRAQLGKGADEILLPEELDAVRAIYIFGTEVSSSQDAFQNGLAGWTLPRGNLASLADVAMLTNLEVLLVNYQSLDDLSPVSSLNNLRSLDVRHTYVSDVSPLKGLPALESICLFDTNVESLAPFAGERQITELELGRTLIDGIEDIPELKNLTRLSLRERKLLSLDGIERFEKLEWLMLCGTGAEDLSPLMSLPGLKEVVLDETMRPAAEALGETRFTVRYE